MIEDSPFGVTTLSFPPSTALYTTGCTSHGMDFPLPVLIQTIGLPQPLQAVTLMVIPPYYLFLSFSVP